MAPSQSRDSLHKVEEHSGKIGVFPKRRLSNLAGNIFENRPFLESVAVDSCIQSC